MKKEIKLSIPKFKERPSCPVCFSKNYDIRFNKKIKKKYLDLLQKIYKYKNSNKNVALFKESNIIICYCKNCSLKFHKLVPNSNTLKFIYTSLIDSETSKRKNLRNEPLKFKKSFLLLKRLRSTLKGNFDKKLNHLDFGCGWGTMLKASKYLNFNCIGIEQSKDQVENMKLFDIRVYSSIKILNEKEGCPKIDIITLNQVLEHVTNPNIILKELRQLINEHGILYISVPPYVNNSQITADDIFVKGPLQPFEHLNCFSRNSMENLAKNSGWILLGPRICNKNIISIFRKYNFIKIILLIIHSLIKKGTYYMLPLR